MPYADPEYQKKYHEKNKEKLKKLKKNYIDNNHNVFKINQWIHMKIKLQDDEDWDSVYIQWLIQEKCDDCDCELTFGIGVGSRCLDHDHKTNFIRGIVCRGCNVRRGS